MGSCNLIPKLTTKISNYSKEACLEIEILNKISKMPCVTNFCVEVGIKIKVEECSKWMLRLDDAID